MPGLGIASTGANRGDRESVMVGGGEAKNIKMEVGKTNSPESGGGGGAVWTESKKISTADLGIRSIKIKNQIS